MKQIVQLILLLCFTFLGCETSTQKQTTKTKPGNLHVDTVEKSTTAVNPSMNTDTLAIASKAAVFFQPNSQQIEQRMKKTNEQDFRAGADDYIYYVNVSAEYLEKQGLKVIDAKNRKYIRFILADNKTQLIKLDTLPDLWGMYLFDPAKKPYYADITAIEDEYDVYYKK